MRAGEHPHFLTASRQDYKRMLLLYGRRWRNDANILLLYHAVEQTDNLHDIGCTVGRLFHSFRNVGQQREQERLKPFTII